MRHRDHALDILRIIACIMVVVMHSPIPSAQANGPFLTALSLFTAPCIGLFFMVSGALLLPVNTDYNTFIKRRLSKVVMPTLIWSAVYIGASAYASGDYSKIWHSLLSLPFSPQGSSVLWFMYTLIGLYLLAPILGSWASAASRRELQTVLALWCVTLCYPIIELFATVNETSTGILYYFNGYAGYFLLGYYLKRFPGAVSTRMALPVAIVGVAILYYTRTRGIEIDFYRMFWYLSIFIAAMCVTVWNTVTAICRHLDTKEKDGGGIWLYINRLSDITFGIYLIHILVMRYWLWNLGWIQAIQSYALQTLVVAVVTLAVSAAACALLSLTPLSTAAIAYRPKARCARISG